MDIVEMLDTCKQRLNLPSDYALAKEFEVSPSRINAYRKGREHPDTYICFRIAEIIGESPTKVIATVEAKTQRNERKSLYFQRFFSIAALWIVLGAIPASYVGSSDNAHAAGSRMDKDIKAHYAKLNKW